MGKLSDVIAAVQALHADAELAGFVAEAERFYPQISAAAADELYDGWLDAIGVSAPC